MLFTFDLLTYAYLLTLTYTGRHRGGRWDPAAGGLAEDGRRGGQDEKVSYGPCCAGHRKARLPGQLPLISCFRGRWPF